MGEFINALIVRDNNEEKVRKTLKKIGSGPEGSLSFEDCQYIEYNRGVNVLLEDNMEFGCEKIAKTLSKELSCPVMLCYIFDGDFWGYFFYNKGEDLDWFMSMPDYFGEAPEEERQMAAGDSKMIADFFYVEEGKIENYLQIWPMDIWDREEDTYAYEGDEYPAGQCWQIVDFMRAIGFPYESKE